MYLVIVQCDICDVIRFGSTDVIQE